MAGLAQAIEGERQVGSGNRSASSSQVALGPALVLVHDGVGDTLVYKNLARRMPAMVKVIGIEPHGTGYWPILHTRIPDMAAYYVQQLRQIQPQGPYFLGGLCAGGKIAFEMALQLEAQGLPVGFVALMDAPGPRLRVKARLTKKRQSGAVRRSPARARGGLSASSPPRQISEGCAKVEELPDLRNDLPGQEALRHAPIPNAPRRARLRTPVTPILCRVYPWWSSWTSRARNIRPVVCLRGRPFSSAQVKEKGPTNPS